MASDFAKRPKAKVGKRAPQKLNSTETKFRTSSISVRSQQISIDKKGGEEEGNNNNSKKKKKKKASSSSSSFSGNELSSSRGITLSTLQTSLRHPAASVRSSSLRGIRDIVCSVVPVRGDDGRDADFDDLSSALESNLSSLLTSACRCWLDEDDGVRFLSIQLLGDVFRVVDKSLDKLVPFLPLLCAYASSALNGLDRDVRVDGAKVVAMLASSLPVCSSLELSPSWSSSLLTKEMGKYADVFLPSLERLLASLSVIGRGKDNVGRAPETRKRKRGERPVKPDDAVLLALAYLLRSSLCSAPTFATADFFDSSPRHRTAVKEHSFLKGESAARNAILILRPTNAATGPPIRSIYDLSSPPTRHVGDEDASPDHAGPSTQSTPKLQQMTSLLDTLRIKLVELVDVGHAAHHGKGLVLPLSAFITLDVLVQTIRLAHAHCRMTVPMLQNTSSSSSSKTNAIGSPLEQSLLTYRTSLHKMTSFLLDNFPIHPSDTHIHISSQTNPNMHSHLVSQPTPYERCEYTNANLCLALVELGNCIPRQRAWIDAVVSHVLSRLDRDDLFVHDDDNRNNDDNANDDNQDNNGNRGNQDNNGNNDQDKHNEKETVRLRSTSMLLKVLHKLLLRPTSFPFRYLLPQTNRTQLTIALGRVFFPPILQSVSVTDRGACNELRNVETLANATAGRSAVVLLASLVKERWDCCRGMVRSVPPFKDSDKDDCQNEDHTMIDHPNENDLRLLHMTSILPIYIRVWRDRFIKETEMALTTLLSIVRLWSTHETTSKHPTQQQQDDAISKLCIQLRSSLEVMVISNHQKVQIHDGTSNKSCGSTLFEKLPERIQNLALGLIVLLKRPTDAMVLSLSNICARAHRHSSFSGHADFVISPIMVNYIMETMHSLRKTISMQSYLGFVLRSSGIDIADAAHFISTPSLLSSSSSSPPHCSEAVFSYDGAICQMTRFLKNSCDKASTKVLPMIRPAIERWLRTSEVGITDVVGVAPSIDSNREPSSLSKLLKQMIRVRAAVSIIAAFVWEERMASFVSTNCHDDGFFVETIQWDDKLDHLLISSICDLCEMSVAVWKMNATMTNSQIDRVDEGFEQQYLARLLGPVSLLLRYRRGMFHRYLDEISKRSLVGEIKLTSSTARIGKETYIIEAHTKSLLLILKSKEPTSVVSILRQHDNDNDDDDDDGKLKTSLMSFSQNVRKSIMEGHVLARVAEKLNHQAKLAAGVLL